MPSYFVRVCLSYSFAQEMNERDIFPVSVLEQNLPAAFQTKRLFHRYTFGLLQMEAENPKAIRETVKTVWSDLYPNHPDAVRLMIAPYSEDDIGKLMRFVYTAYYGAEPYLEMLTEIAEMIPLLKERDAMKAISTRSYLFGIDPGCGFTTLLSSFGDFLRRMGVFGEEGEQRSKYIEYVLGKETGGGCIDADDLVGELKSAEEITLNVVGMDISYYLEGQKLDELRQFVRRLRDLAMTYIFVFRIPYLETKAMKDLESVLADQLVLRTVAIPPLHNHVLREFFWDALSRYGYAMDDALVETFYRKLNEERTDGRFYGFRTVDKIAREIVLWKARHDAESDACGIEVQKDRIVPDDLANYVKDPSAKKTGYDELSELIGMETIRDRIREIVSQVKISMQNERLDRPCIHMRFVGAPGTGKTTVARIIGKIFQEEGILRKGAFLEYSARNLCAEYVGQTAVKTVAICRDAYGSVLFIDEAYALYENTHQSNDYGKEALTTLISEMENHRDDMMVIMAGYTDDMETLMEGNAGLRSRMPYVISFPNYTRDQLHAIFMSMVSRHFDYTPELETESRTYFNNLSDSFVQSREFSNARFVRNLYERTWSKGALRASMAGLSQIALTKEDFIAASSEKEFREKLKQTIKVGF